MRLTWRTVFRAVPVPVIYADMHETARAFRVNGEQRGPLVRIRVGYERDEGLLQHELEHVRQFWIAVFAGALVGVSASVLTAALMWPVSWLSVTATAAAAGALAHPLLYRFARRYRLRAEGRAYFVQTRYPNRRGNGQALTFSAAAARLSSGHYRLGISVNQARAYLEELR